MLDVIHFFFEEDHRYQTAEEAKGVEELRTSLYQSMYDKSYNYKSSNKKSSEFSSTPSDEVKPYIPPTEFDPVSGLPFNSELDAPFG